MTRRRAPLLLGKVCSSQQSISWSTPALWRTLSQNSIAKELTGHTHAIILLREWLSCAKNCRQLTENHKEHRPRRPNQILCSQACSESLLQTVGARQPQSLPLIRRRPMLHEFIVHAAPWLHHKYQNNRFFPLNTILPENQPLLHSLRQ
jgi:hypothetical protein